MSSTRIWTKVWRTATIWAFLYQGCPTSTILSYRKKNFVFSKLNTYLKLQIDVTPVFQPWSHDILLLFLACHITSFSVRYLPCVSRKNEWFFSISRRVADFFRSPEPVNGCGEVGDNGGRPYDKLLADCMAFSKARNAFVFLVVGDCRYSSIFLDSSLSLSCKRSNNFKYLKRIILLKLS
jgi:hypothetical protein